MVSHIRVEKKAYMLSKVELERRKLAYVYWELGGRRGYMIGRPDIIEDIKNLQSVLVTVEEEKKYKPIDMYMRMQQGKMGRTFTTNATYRVRILKEVRNPQPHIIWEII